MHDLRRKDDRTPAEIVGPTKVLAGQRWLNRAVVIAYAEEMQQGTFAWERWQADQPMAMQVSRRGLMIDQGHHRWVAAHLAQISIPVIVELRYDWWPEGAAFGVTWDQVRWDE